MFRYAICNETFQDWPFDRAFAFARECGYTGIEIAPFTLARYATEVLPRQRAQVRRQAEAAGLEVVGLHWLLAKTEGFYLTSPDRAVQSKTADYLCELARLCRDLGGSIMVLGSPQQRNLLPGVTKPQAMGYAADVLRAALPVLDECGVTIALEPLGPAEGDFLLTAAEGRELINLVNSPHVRLHLDCKAMASEAQPPADIIRTNRDIMVHFHANDPNRQGPGMGQLDMKPIFQALNAIDWRGWVSVEVFDYTPGIEHLARQSMQNMLAAAAVT
ncbi:MAG TPA: sugar phosphate isomerase/epimerase family protein [Pirellulales bacterium]|nr:sugar phosphate isomerase/epimerase family protein [Pirellulales bacterium]